jgi:glucokinase
MLIAGDIGGTKTRLALVSPDSGPRTFVAEREYHSADFKGLQPIVTAFLAETGAQATSACFDVAGPVIDGTGPPDQSALGSVGIRPRGRPWAAAGQPAE